MSECLNYHSVIYILTILQIIPHVKSYYSGMFEWTYAVQYLPFLLAGGGGGGGGVGDFLGNNYLICI